MGTQNTSTKPLDDLTNNDINILLLGETGVGKSTFINSIANYLHFEDFKNIENKTPLFLVPSTLTIRDSEGKPKVVKVGGINKNECPQIGGSATQDIKTYIVPVCEGKLRLCIIDTPGMSCTRGSKDDGLICENILSYLNNLQKLHVICFLMNPNNIDSVQLFQYCKKQILSSLEKSALNNLIFIFTNTRSTNYTGGDTLQRLQTVTGEMRLKNNVFCVDNEAFLFLIFTKNNIKINEEQQSDFVASWNISVQECLRMVSYIIGDKNQAPLKPIQIKNNMCLNKNRCLILQLYKPLADIIELIDNNTCILKQHIVELSKPNQTVNDLKKKLYIPVVNLEVIQLKQPVTVCTASKCLEIYKVANIHKRHYRQNCHDPSIIVGSGLRNCEVMDNMLCKICGCSWFAHMQVYYFTKAIEDELVISDTVQINTYNEDHITTEVEKIKTQICKRLNEYEREWNTITEILTKFGYFLQKNSLTSYNDSHEKYITSLIESATHLKIDTSYLLNHLDLYKQKKKELYRSMFFNDTTLDLLDLLYYISQLYVLKHTGKKILELVKSQRTPMEFKYNQTIEYVQFVVTDEVNSKVNEQEHMLEHSGKFFLEPLRNQKTTLQVEYNQTIEYAHFVVTDEINSKVSEQEPPPAYEEIAHDYSQLPPKCPRWFCCNNFLLQKVNLSQKKTPRQ